MVSQVYLVKMTIREVFRGAKYNDTCISEIVPVVTPYQKGQILRVYTNKTEDTIFIDTIHRKKVILDRDPSAVFQIIDTTRDKQWVIAIQMPTHPGESRVETSYFLYNTSLGCKLSSQDLGQHVGELYDFDSGNGTVLLNYLNLKTMNIDQLDVNNAKALCIRARQQAHHKNDKAKGGSE